MDFKVFVSSTSRDLSAYREAIVRAISAVQFLRPINQENFGVVPATPLAHCIRLVQQSDLYVGIFGHFRGWEVEGDASRRSITEIEYDTAIDSEKPVFAIVAPESFPVPANLIGSDSERSRQAQFLKRVTTAHVVSFDMSSPERVATTILASLLNHLAYENIIKLIAPAAGPPEKASREDVSEAILELSHYVAINYEALITLPARTALQELIREVTGRLAESKAVNEKAALLKQLGNLFYPIEFQRSQDFYLQSLQFSADTFVMNRLGILAMRVGDFTSARTYFQSIIDCGSDDKTVVLQALLNLGSAESNSGHFVEAEDAARKSLELAQQLDDAQYIARAHTLKAALFLQTNDFERALEHSTKAYHLELTRGNIDGASHDINNTVSIYRRSRSTESAIPLAREALEINMKAHRPEGIGIAYWNLCQLYEESDDLQSALAAGLDAVKAFVEADNPRLVAEAYYTSAILNLRLKKIEKGVELFEAAQKYFLRASDHRRYLEMAFFAGAVLCEAGNIKTATKLCSDAMKVALPRLETDGALGESFSLYYDQLVLNGNSSAARRLLRRASNWFEKVGNLHERERLERLIGTLYVHEQSFDRALLTFSGIEHRGAEFGDAAEKARYLGDYGNSLMAVGNFDKAYECLRKCIDIFEYLGDVQGLATNYTNLASAASLLGKTAEALRYHNLAVKCESEIGTKGLHPADALNQARLFEMPRAR